MKYVTVSIAIPNMYETICGAILAEIFPERIMMDCINIPTKDRMPRIIKQTS